MKCGCDKDKDGIDTDVLFDLPQVMFDSISSKIGLKKGTKYNDDIKKMLKEDAKLNNKNLRDYLTENPDVSKQITIIEMKKQGGLLKYQVGGQIQNITNSGNDMNRLNQVKMYSDLQAPVTGMQKGGQVNDQKEFIQWLAQQLGVNSEEELKAAVAQMGEQGLKQAQQMYAKQKGKQQGGMFKAKNGGILKYQQAGKFKQFADKEIVKTSDNKARYIPGTYDTDLGANSYGGIKSNKEFDATTQNAQAKIDYSQGVGQRTQAGLQGNRGTEGINLTDRLAQERVDLQKNFNTVYNTPEFQKRIIVGKDNKKYVTDTTGKYNLGLYEEENTPNQIPVEKQELDIEIPNGFQKMRKTIPAGNTDKVEIINGKKTLIPGDPNSYHVEYLYNPDTKEEKVIRKTILAPGSNSTIMTGKGHNKQVTTKIGTANNIIEKKQIGGLLKYKQK